MPPTPLHHVVVPLLVALSLGACVSGTDAEVDDPASPEVDDRDRDHGRAGPSGARRRHSEPACTDTGVCAGCVVDGERRTRVRVWVTDGNGKTLDQWLACPDPDPRRGR